MQNNNDIPSADAFEAHAEGIKTKVTDRVSQAFDAAQQKGFGDLLDFGIVNLPFAGGAADLANKATAAIGSAREGTEELAAQIKETGAAYHDNDGAVAAEFNRFTSETEQQ
ncbi:hypothetical protein [Glycomyces harbinensis]|uniref:Excreted virulence factor EspC, type VII ESX diderm n=1 Tax=Glycomyces harbinensis TaxID=58114 RepID=A0A1G6VPE2_9ACTN|nr:hypothetical protein [Glycomyces harbinensis]SDD54877.1 hypothetical protein SAMN05216270_10534 [Glycomyces harbinensis]